MQPLKNRTMLAVVGDSAVGKTCLIHLFSRGIFPDPAPTGWQDYPADMDVDGVRASVSIWDTSGWKADQLFRPLFFDEELSPLVWETKVFLFCFRVDDSRSYVSIATEWYAELMGKFPGLPFILVGTKTDLRDGSDQSSCDQQHFVSRAQGEKMATEIQAFKYVECSAKENTGVTEVFEEAVRAFRCPRRPFSLNPNSLPSDSLRPNSLHSKSKHRRCSLL